jgi:DNA-binding transcriptional MerR regulator
MQDTPPRQPQPTTPQTHEEHFRISVVSNLTGLPANTIRTWERRYDVVEPRRTDCGARLYTQDDITRLQLIRTLCQYNENISALASLSNAQLQERLTRHTAPSHHTQPQRLRVLLGDRSLHTQLRANPLDSQPLHILLSAPSPHELLPLLSPELHPDALLVGLSWLGPEPARTLQTLQAQAAPRLTLVLYDFATRDTLHSLSALGARLLRAPIRTSSLCQLLQDHLPPLPTHAPTPPTPTPHNAPDTTNTHRRLSDEQLTLLRERKTHIDCECPNHLSTLASALVAFEHYSAHCTHRDDADAQLHQVIHQKTSQARAIIEDLILMICQQEDIQL